MVQICLNSYYQASPNSCWTPINSSHQEFIRQVRIQKQTSLKHCKCNDGCLGCPVRPVIVRIRTKMFKNQFQSFYVEELVCSPLNMKTTETSKIYRYEVSIRNNQCVESRQFLSIINHKEASLREASFQLLLRASAFGCIRRALRAQR